MIINIFEILTVFKSFLIVMNLKLITETMKLKCNMITRLANKTNHFLKNIYNICNF